MNGTWPLLATLALSACSVHHVGDPPAPPLAAPLPERFVEGGIDGAPIEAWWTTFGDPELTRLVSLVIADNLELVPLPDEPPSELFEPHD